MDFGQEIQSHMPITKFMKMNSLFEKKIMPFNHTVKCKQQDT